MNAVIAAPPVGGHLVGLELERGDRPATSEERTVLDDVEGPVVDLGYGPGRLVVERAARRVPALGVDSSPDAVALARRRDAGVVQRDLFGRLPGEGRWATALLFDGNVGIGGGPVCLLCRGRRRVRPGGHDDHGGRTARSRVAARLAVAGDRRAPSAELPWAVVGADAVGGLATTAGFELMSLDETISGRWFARLRGVPA